LRGGGLLPDLRADWRARTLDWVVIMIVKGRKEVAMGNNRIRSNLAGKMVMFREEIRNKTAREMSGYKKGIVG
jgi:hypothetical protein